MDYQNKDVLEILVNKGYTIPKMADELNVSGSTIKRWLKKFNLKTNNTEKRGIRFITNCNFCSKEISKLSSELNNSKSKFLYCSRTCAASYNNTIMPKRKISTICSKNNCNSLIHKVGSTLCKNHFNEYSSYSILNKTLFEYRQHHKLSNTPKASIYRHIRDNARSSNKHLTKCPCANCGYKLHVEICHIRAISDFEDFNTIGEVNSKDNIIQLCRNCHWELDKGYLKIEDIYK